MHVLYRYIDSNLSYKLQFNKGKQQISCSELSKLSYKLCAGLIIIRIKNSNLKKFKFQ